MATIRPRQTARASASGCFLWTFQILPLMTTRSTATGTAGAGAASVSEAKSVRRQRDIVRPLWTKGAFASTYAIWAGPQARGGKTIAIHPPGACSLSTGAWMCFCQIPGLFRRGLIMAIRWPGLVPALLLVVGTSHAEDKDVKLDGTWKVMKLEAGGQSAPEDL